MWKRRRTWILTIALAGTALAVYFEPSHCVRGWLWGEAFYDGRPTSYWRGLVTDALEIDWANFPRSTWFDRLKRRVGYEPAERHTFQLMRDPNVDPVLRELADDANANVAAFAQDMLKADRAVEDEAYQTWLGLLKKHNMR